MHFIYDIKKRMNPHFIDDVQEIAAARRSEEEETGRRQALEVRRLQNHVCVCVRACVCVFLCVRRSQPSPYPSPTHIFTPSMYV